MRIIQFKLNKVFVTHKLFVKFISNFIKIMELIQKNTYNMYTIKQYIN